jgi:hypothetical protein
MSLVCWLDCRLLPENRREVQGWNFTAGLIKKNLVILSVNLKHVNVRAIATKSGRDIHRSQKKHCK